MATQVTSHKLAVEELEMQFDMLSRLAVGETVVSAVVSCDVFSGVDASAAAMISGTPTILNNVVSQKIVGGVPGVIYLISCAVRTSRNNVPINQAKLAVLASSVAVPVEA